VERLISMPPLNPDERKEPDERIAYVLDTVRVTVQGLGNTDHLDRL
jgi:hypothetical protein